MRRGFFLKYPDLSKKYTHAEYFWSSYLLTILIKIIDVLDDKSIKFRAGSSVIMSPSNRSKTCRSFLWNFVSSKFRIRLTNSYLQDPSLQEWLCSKNLSGPHVSISYLFTRWVGGGKKKKKQNPSLRRAVSKWRSQLLSLRSILHLLLLIWEVPTCSKERRRRHTSNQNAWSTTRSSLKKKSAPSRQLSS